MTTSCVASICSGAFVLAATGALDGLRATTHWRHEHENAEPALPRRGRHDRRRLDRARTRPPRATPLETTRLAVERVAAESGFGSAAVMRQHFGKCVGTTPVAYRHAFSRGEE